MAAPSASGTRLGRGAEERRVSGSNVSRNCRATRGKTGRHRGGADDSGRVREREAARRKVSRYLAPPLFRLNHSFRYFTAICTMLVALLSIVSFILSRPAPTRERGI